MKKQRRNKLTPTMIAQIQERRRSGAAYATLARDFGLSEGSIRNAILAPAPAAPVAPPAPPPAVLAASEAPPVAVALNESPLEAPPTLSELRTWLGGQVRALRADVEAAPDAPSKAAANRSLVATQALLTRIMPPERLSPEVGVFVDAAAMIAMRDEAARKWHELIDLVADAIEAGEL